MYLYLVGKKLLLFEHHVWIGHAKSQWKEKIPFGYNELKKFQQRAALLLQGCIVILGWYSFV